MASSYTNFDWAIYADATFAGLSALIPIPLADNFAEWVFERRIPRAIVRRRKVKVPPEILGQLNRGEKGCLWSLLTFPFWLAWQLGKDLLGKIVYIISIRDATEKLSYYWHYAFLVDYALAAGHFADRESAWLARRAMNRALSSGQVSPMRGLAEQVGGQTLRLGRRLGRSVRKALRRGEEDDAIDERREMMADAWQQYAGHLEAFAKAYDGHFARLEVEDRVRAERYQRGRRKTE